MSAENPTGAAAPQRVALVAVLCSLSIPIAVAYALMYHFSCNIPVIDDYHAILDFSLHFLSLTTFREKFFYFLSAQHNDYKLMTQQLVLIAQLRLIHHINFSFLILLGNLLLLPILLTLWKVYFREEKNLLRRALLFLPVAWILFGLNYAETVDFPISGLQVLAVILLSLVALYLLGRSMAEPGQRSFVLAIVVAIAGCLTYANAFLLAPVGLLVLARRRMYMRSIVWCAAFVVPLVPFLYRYHSTSHFRPRDLPWTPVFFSSFLGSAALFLPLAVTLGLAMLTVYWDAARKHYDRENPAAFLIASWVLVCAAVVTLGRVGGGLWVSHSSRYRIYSDLLLIFCYGYLAPRVARSALSPTKKLRLYQGAVALAVLFGLSGDVYGWKLLHTRRQELMIGLAQYQSNPAVYSPMYFVLRSNESGNAGAEEAARFTLGRAITAGVYVPPGWAPSNGVPLGAAPSTR